jgi:hypothetical protein
MAARSFPVEATNMVSSEVSPTATRTSSSGVAVANSSAAGSHAGKHALVALGAA